MATSVTEPGERPGFSFSFKFLTFFGVVLDRYVTSKEKYEGTKEVGI